MRSTEECVLAGEVVVFPEREYCGEVISPPGCLVLPCQQIIHGIFRFIFSAAVGDYIALHAATDGEG